VTACTIARSASATVGSKSTSTGTRAGPPRHNSLLIVTFDENAGGRVKPIFTIIVGANVRPGVYRERLNHYRLLRTIEEAYGLPALGRAKGVRPFSTIWTS
jgi:hypothetical protein